MPKEIVLVIVALIITGGLAFLVLSGQTPTGPVIEPVIPPAEAVRNIFAQKYNKDRSEIAITLSKETKTHARGEVVFSPGGPENSGLFLATKVNNNWMLVYEGQGAIYCSVVRPYNFPEDMIADCVGEAVEAKDKAREACVSSGGEVTTALCCESASDYPNLCLIGPCGCSPENSHEIEICGCGEERCFDGEECVSFSLE